ncbi:hypothetical protein VA249_16210 [Vibrio alfacsensis]|uniref:hypothetical protein n=1 Tax=Vibrio alfacsensis TaxID=1074311 RepID=UPI001BEDDA44|nr:hypothetical protein [Vibrio alfacsensis]BBM64975.1 hypothetical protein VA249_16210 [Vibrio alfacsensis]
MKNFKINPFEKFPLIKIEINESGILLKDYEKPYFLLFYLCKAKGLFLSRVVKDVLLLSDFVDMKQLEMLSLDILEQYEQTKLLQFPRYFQYYDGAYLTTLKEYKKYHRKKKRFPELPDSNDVDRSVVEYQF